MNILDTPILGLGVKAGNKVNWTAREAVEGVQIFGGIGSGKSSGSGRTLALKYLKAGYGGLVLTAKPDECELWDKYCKIAGRSNDLVVIEDGKHNYFNFLEYESRGGSQKAITENLVQVLKTVIRASEEKAHGASDDPFWESALDMLLFNTLDLCKLAYNRVSIQDLYHIVQSIPRNDNQTQSNSENQNPFTAAFTIACEKVKAECAEWERKLNVEDISLLKKNGGYQQRMQNEVPNFRLLKFIDGFYFDTYKNLSEKTRSIIDFSFSSFLYRLLREPIFSLFCNNPTNVFPEQCETGKIILVNLPVKLYHKVGRDCQILIKYCWQRAMEKRKVTDDTKPVFLWADEAQNFLHEYDAEYQATARSSRIATVYISQNIPNYHANMGGGKSEFRVKSFLGTLGTKIFHANADIETNRYASDLIGQTYFAETSSTFSSKNDGGISITDSLKVDKKIKPEDFGRLRTGGERNSFAVDGVAHFQSNILPQKENHLILEFSQKFTP